MNAKRPEGDSLPVPDKDALARSETLRSAIAAEIERAGGWMPFSRFMELALYAPGLGYYSGANVKFGRSERDGSDFVTAPELTPFFGMALAEPLAQALETSGTDSLMEFGAGTGKLAADVLGALEAHGRPRDRYFIVELSGELRQRQHDTIARLAPKALPRVTWLDALPERFDGVVLGNEVLDAMPVDLHARVDGRWHERGVTVHGRDFIWSDRPLREQANGASGTREPHPHWQRRITGADYLSESHAAAHAFIGTVCRMLGRGAAFFIDYGFPAHEYYHPQRDGGTLMCHFRHRTHTDPFLYPGLQDITAHVDFTGIAQAALDAQAEILGYSTQGRFLLNAGIAQRLSEQIPSEDPTRYLPASNALHKLLFESEMGELFKVIALGKGLDASLPVFASGDRSHTLFDELD